MSKWILIIFVTLHGNDTEVVQVEFQSRELCQGASPIIIREYERVLPESASAKIKGICIQTAREIPDDIS